MRPVPIESKDGFVPGKGKPHIAKRYGFWYAFQNNGSPTLATIHPNLEWRWTCTSFGSKEKAGVSVRNLCWRLNNNGNFSFCDTKNMQLRGLVK